MAKGFWSFLTRWFFSRSISTVIAKVFFHTDTLLVITHGVEWSVPASCMKEEETGTRHRREKTGKKTSQSHFRGLPLVCFTLLDGNTDTSLWFGGNCRRKGVLAEDGCAPPKTSTLITSLIDRRVVSSLPELCSRFTIVQTAMAACYL